MELPGGIILSFVLIEHRQVTQNQSYVDIVGAEDFFMNRECAPVKWLGIRIPAPQSVDARKVVECGRDVPLIFRGRFLPDGESPAEEGFRIRILAGGVIKRCQVIDCAALKNKLSK